MKTFFEKTSEF